MEKKQGVGARGWCKEGARGVESIFKVLNKTGIVTSVRVSEHTF